MPSAYETASLQDWANREILTPIAHNLMKVWPDAAYEVGPGWLPEETEVLQGHVRLHFSFPHKFQGSSEIVRVEKQRVYDPMILRLRMQNDDLGHFVKVESRALASELCGFLMGQP